VDGGAGVRKRRQRFGVGADVLQVLCEQHPLPAVIMVGRCRLTL
jgi:hypothetical protein